MTREEQAKYIADYCDGFKKLLLAKIDRIPPHWDRAEIQQWIAETAQWIAETARDAYTVKVTPAREHKRDLAEDVARTRLFGRDARTMRRLCPACARLGVEWVKAVEKRDALEHSIADVC
jgi:hypothetical protein